MAVTETAPAGVQVAQPQPTTPTLNQPLSTQEQVTLASQSIDRHTAVVAAVLPQNEE